MKYSSPEEVLKNIWGYPSFRPLQSEIIHSILKGHETLAVLPTGGGKSLCFQVPALCMEGICVVITPLIALMKDQVEQLKNLGQKAAAVYSGISFKEIDIILDNCVHNQIKFLYVSPERLKTELFIERARRMNISLLAVDEAHCISQWGYDFRPSYLQINEFRQYAAEAGMIALTATATRDVINDIVKKLEFTADHRVFIQSFARSNLSFNIRKSEDKEARILEIISRIKGSAIVYARTRKKTKELAELIIKKNISADYYHAGLSHQERITKQENWMRNEFSVMVATNAFGMGINKPDVRIVVHGDLPGNMESYYQEAGRAGRDGNKAYAVIVYHEKDKDELRNRIKTATPEPKIIKRTYQSLANYYKIAVGSSLFTSYDFDINDFVKTYNLDYLETFYSLKKLEDQEFIQLSESFYHPSKIIFKVNHEELYRFEVANRSTEPLIKALLRLYGGELYTHFVIISEKRLASMVKSSIRDIEKKLDFLDAQEILIYDKQKDKPRITFTTPRYDANKLPLDVEFLEKRRSLDLDKAEAVLQYCTEEKVCRAAFIRNYFGETAVKDCGLCDVCIKKKTGQASGNLAAEIRECIRDRLSKRPSSIRDLVHNFGHLDKDILLESVQILLESQEIYYDEKGFLHFTGAEK